MNLKKLFQLREMNTFQVIAVTGFVMTLVAQAVLHFLNKTIPNFEWLYICWLILFIGGYLRNITAKPDDHHHH